MTEFFFWTIYTGEKVNPSFDKSFHREYTFPWVRMAKSLKYNLGVIFAILLSTTVLVNSLPTSVLVDTKQQQNGQATTTALNKGKNFHFVN